MSSNPHTRIFACTSELRGVVNPINGKSIKEGVQVFMHIQMGQPIATSANKKYFLMEGILSSSFSDTNDGFGKR